MHISDIFEDDGTTTTHLIACSTEEIRLLAVVAMEPLRQILEGNLQIPDMPMGETIAATEIYIALQRYLLPTH